MPVHQDLESCFRSRWRIHNKFQWERSSNEPRANVPTYIPTRLMSRKDERICNGAFFYLEWRTSRNTCNRVDMKSSECAAGNCNRAIGLFSHFADHVCSKYFRVVHSNHSQNEDQQPLCATTQLRSHCTIRRRNTNLHVNCTPRALYVSPTSASCRISVSSLSSFV
jgi:hypothetical protein